MPRPTSESHKQGVATTGKPSCTSIFTPPFCSICSYPSLTRFHCALSTLPSHVVRLWPTSLLFHFVSSVNKLQKLYSTVDNVTFDQKTIWSEETFILKQHTHTHTGDTNHWWKLRERDNWTWASMNIRIIMDTLVTPDWQQSTVARWSVTVPYRQCLGLWPSVWRHFSHAER